PAQQWLPLAVRFRTILRLDQQWAWEPIAAAGRHPCDQGRENSIQICRNSNSPECIDDRCPAESSKPAAQERRPAVSNNRGIASKSQHHAAKTMLTRLRRAAGPRRCATPVRPDEAHKSPYSLSDATLPVAANLSQPAAASAQPRAEELG